MNIRSILICLPLLLLACSSANTNNEVALQDAKAEQPNSKIIVGAEDFEAYLPILKDKSIGLVVNQTSQVQSEHLVDFLLSKKVKVKSIFAPEHGFRGNADAGGYIKDGKDVNSGLPIYSLHGKNKKPRQEQLEDLDMMVFDIQDVGARFYTYISTLHYVMEACAEKGISLMILDRPNPNGHYVDGPVMEREFSSFVGMHPIPVVHGMTIGEYAQMINGEKWLPGDKKCTLIIVRCQNYNHDSEYILPIKPSPNLPNNRSIYLYPSLCLFEGTEISVGRGTKKQFQVLGHPDLEKTKFPFSFVPTSMEGASNPKLKGKVCQGINYARMEASDLKKRAKINLSTLINLYKAFPDKENFFNNFFNKLAGNSSIQEMIKAGKTEDEIRATWRDGLAKFKVKRRKYLLYE